MSPDDIPEVEVYPDIDKVSISKKDKVITLGDVEYKLIMCYICPICKEPILAYWVLDGNPRATDKTVGRSLRDSGFGAYRFFESGDNQGFEYDISRDAKKRHLHQEYSTPQYSYQDKELLSSWDLFHELNPIITINNLFQKMINKGHFERLFAESHVFTEDQTLCLQFIEIMREYPELFKVIDDLNRHGKPIFMLQTVKWEGRFSRYSTNNYEGVQETAKIFDSKLLKGLNFADKVSEVWEILDEGEK